MVATIELRLRTLGGLALEGAIGRNGATLQRKPLALLAVLAVAGRNSISRDLVVGLLWPESDTERARNSLNQTLSALRRDAGAPELVLGTTELRLNPEVMTSDVAEFEAALAAGDLERAAALYGGPFLDGIYLRNVPEFEQWADRERQRLAHCAAATLERLATAATERGDKQGAVTWWRRRAGLERTSTAATTGLVRALIDAGDREEAIRQVQTYAALVRAELDAEPDPTLMHLVEQLRVAPTSPSASNGAVIARSDDESRPVLPAKGPPAADVGPSLHSVVPAEAATEGRPSAAVMPAQAGIQGPVETLDSRLRGNDNQDDAGLHWRSGGARLRGQDDPASLAARTPVRRVRRRSLVWATAVALSAVAVIGAAYATRPRIEPKLVIVPPFENQTGDTGFTVVGSMAADWVRQGLAHTGLVEVVDARAMLRDASRKADSPSGTDQWRTVARRAGAAMIVHGSVYKQRDTLLVHTQIVRASDGKVLYAGEPIAGAAADPRTVLEPARQRVMGALAALEDPRFASWQKVIVQPPRYDAYEEFLAGIDGHNANRPAEAFRHFYTAARLDTTFVQAKLRAIVAAGETYDDSLSALARPLVDAVRAQGDRLSRYDRAMLDYVMAATVFDNDGALAAARRMTEAVPSDVWGLVHHARAARYANRFDEALRELHRADVARGLAREDGDYWFEERQAHHSAGDYVGELSEASRCRELAALPNLKCEEFAFYALAALGRESSVDSLIMVLLSAPSKRQLGELYVGAGFEYHVHGHREAERRAFARAREWFETRQPRPADLLVEIDWYVGNWAAVRDYWTAQLASHPQEVKQRGLGELGAAAAHLGDSATARAMVERIEALVTEPVWGKPLWQASVMAALGDRMRAMDFLATAISLGYSPTQNGHQRPGLDPLHGYPPFEALRRPRR